VNAAGCGVLQTSLPSEQCPMCKCYRLWHPSQRSCSVLVDVDTCALHRYAWLGTSPLLSALAASDVYPLASPFEAGHGGTALALHRDSRWILGAHSGRVGSHTLAFPNAC